MFVEGKFELLFKEDKNIFAYIRTYEKTVLFVVCNFYGETIPFVIPTEYMGEREVVLCNYNAPLEENELQPYEARMYLLKLE